MKKLNLFVPLFLPLLALSCGSKKHDNDPSIQLPQPHIQLPENPLPQATVIKFDTSKLQQLTSPRDGSSLKLADFVLNYSGKLCDFEENCGETFSESFDVLSGKEISFDAEKVFLTSDDFTAHFENNAFGVISNNKSLYNPESENAPKQKPCNLSSDLFEKLDGKFYDAGTYTVVFDTEYHYSNTTKKPIGFWLLCEVKKD